MTVTAEHLWKAFYDERRKDSLIALEDVSFTLADNEFVCVVGPSGCGKSTLLRILAGLESSDHGTVRMPSRASVVFQDHGALPWMTVEDNVAYPLRLRGVPRKKRRQEIAPLLDLVGLSEFRKYYPFQLSGGMRQRVSVARALADDSDVMLMDEPFGALDEQTRVAMQQELLRVWEATSKSVLFITHSVDEALILADRIIVLSARPGRISADFRVPFERPRSIAGIRRQPEYATLTEKLWTLLGEDEEEAA